MTDEIQKSRSPNSPRLELQEALSLTRKLYDKIGRSAVNIDIAVGPLGYSSISGASLSAIGALSQYGLIERKARTAQITPLALKILHPTDSEQKDSSIREAALTPKIFQEIREKWHDMAEEVLSNHLIHQKFTPDAAKRAASVYKANSLFAKLDSLSNDVSNKNESETDKSLLENEQTDEIQKSRSPNSPRPGQQKVLATFKIPIGSAEAEIIFTGTELVPEDFDALTAYVSIFKKQYERKAKSADLPPSKSLDQLIKEVI